MSGTDDSSGNSTPFAIRGSSSVFIQRQKDAFDCLQALEEAHKKVTKATKAERNLVKKMAWRPAKPVTESLEAEKEARDKLNASGRNQVVDTFKIPIRPAPRPGSKRRGESDRQYRFSDDPHRDRSKWIHYSLADVDEDGIADHRIATELMRELRRRRQEKEDTEKKEGSGGNPPPGRILFRPKTGRKRRNMDPACETSNASLSSAFSPEFEITCEDQDCNTESDTSNKSEAVQFRLRQRAGRQARCTTVSEENSDHEQEMDVSEPTGTDKDEPGTSSDEPSDLEDGPEGV
ncbi:unnamed protein product [Hymenolepis diminuta]|uniref:Protein TSSC4 n=1 Tax=Hymenolepis diminuta TaxID=6216 RepID=A0A0R3SF79_HYMDI|nr:unnamed protein product [Hymenolepis diminuta]VUZ56385.1 unnamed protein product [Hymenolepis diminuta]